MKERGQNIAGLSGQSPQGEELHAMSGMQTFMRITENCLTAFEQEKDGLLEYILSPPNLNLTYSQVKSKRLCD